MTDILLHPKTARQIKLFWQNPRGCVLITGTAGSGKSKVALSLAIKLLNLVEEEDLSKYPHFLHLKKTEARDEISIEAVREVIRSLKLKTTGQGEIRRIVLIENAELLSLEAQNALLKILEEPNPDTMFILTAPFEGSLLPTIVSRCHRLEIYPVSYSQVVESYSMRYKAQSLETAWRLSQGNAGLLKALLETEDKHPLKEAIIQAKSFLKSSRAERLLVLQNLTKKEDLKLFLEALVKILTAINYSVIDKKQIIQAKKLLGSRRLARTAIDAVDQNVNQKLIKLQLLHNLSL